MCHAAAREHMYNETQAKITLNKDKLAVDGSESAMGPVAACAAALAFVLIISHGACEEAEPCQSRLEYMSEFAEQLQAQLESERQFVATLTGA